MIKFMLSTQFQIALVILNVVVICISISMGVKIMASLALVCNGYVIGVNSVRNILNGISKLEDTTKE